MLFICFFFRHKRGKAVHIEKKMVEMPEIIRQKLMQKISLLGKDDPCFGIDQTEQAGFIIIRKRIVQAAFQQIPVCRFIGSVR